MSLRSASTDRASSTSNRRRPERRAVSTRKREKIIEANHKRLSDFQEKLYAQDRWSLLLIFQGMDAAGKDSAIKSIFRGINPQGCEVTPSSSRQRLELDHDFMWRSVIALPERGRIGIFNRSHYEECLVVRVHPEILAKEKIPPRLVTRNIWRERFEDISAFERYLARNGTMILKFFLNISKEEQRERFLARLEEPAKNWKFSMADIAERALWEKYQAAYQDVIRHTSTRMAPWHVVPADHKWFARVVIGSTIVSALDKLDLQFPESTRRRSSSSRSQGAAGGGEGPRRKRMGRANLRHAHHWRRPSGAESGGSRCASAHPTGRQPERRCDDGISQVAERWRSARSSFAAAFMRGLACSSSRPTIMPDAKARARLSCGGHGARPLPPSFGPQ